MSDYSHMVFTGNVGRNPEMRYTPSGQAVTSFSVASNREYNATSGERVKETTWYRVSVWGNLAEICNKYLKKGSKVLIEGRLTPDKETGGPKVFTKQDKTSSASFDVTATVVNFLSPKSDKLEVDSQLRGEEETPY